MKRMTLLALALGIGLTGCGNIDAGTVNQASDSGQRLNRLELVDSTPDLAVGGDPAKLVSATGYDSADKPVYGPVEQPYSGDIVFSGLPTSTVRVDLDYQRAQGFTLVHRSKAVDFANDDDGLVTLEETSAPLLAAQARSTFTVRIVNNSDYPDDKVFVTVNGKDRAKKAFFYLNFGAGDQNVFQPFQGVDKFEQYSQQLSLLKKEGEHTYTFQCPYDHLVSGRIYLSFDKKIQGLGLNNPADPLSLALPSPTGAPDAQKLFEFMELSATIPDDPQAPQVYTLFANTSVVDFFSVGLGMTLHYQQNQQDVGEVAGFMDDARDLILKEFEAASTPSEFRNYVKKDGTQSILRVLSPVQAVAVQPAGVLSQFLQSAIDSAWSKYSGAALNIPDNLPTHTFGYQWTGVPILNNLLSMTCIKKPQGDGGAGDFQSLGEVCNLPRPSSRIVFFCDDDAPRDPNVPLRNTWRNDGSDGHKRLCSLISAALNRGVFENYSDWGNSAQFYSRGDGKYNHFAKIMHKFALNGKVYGFGYDDVYGQDPTLAKPLSDVNQIVITIPKIPRL